MGSSSLLPLACAVTGHVTRRRRWRRMRAGFWGRVWVLVPPAGAAGRDFDPRTDWRLQTAATLEEETHGGQSCWRRQAHPFPRRRWRCSWASPFGPAGRRSAASPGPPAASGPAGDNQNIWDPTLHVLIRFCCITTRRHDNRAFHLY